MNEEMPMEEADLQKETQNGVPVPVKDKTDPYTRLMITHIENVNFKSYAGKQVLGPFHKVRNYIYASGILLCVCYTYVINLSN